MDKPKEGTTFVSKGPGINLGNPIYWATALKILSHFDIRSNAVSGFMYSLHCLLHLKKYLGVRLSPHYPNPCPGGSILIPRPEISRDFLMAAPKSSEGILAPHELLTDGPRQLIRSDRKVKMSRETLNSLPKILCSSYSRLYKCCSGGGKMYWVQ